MPICDNILNSLVDPFDMKIPFSYSIHFFFSIYSRPVEN